MIKVFGEARSGTTYLEELLRLNGQEVLPNSCKHPSGWKHGFPVYTEGALHVFLMRGVYEWCRSMVTGFDARYSTFTGVFGNQKDKPHQEHWGTWDHMIQCRTDKYWSYRSFAKKFGAVLLKTEYLKAYPEVITAFTDVSEVQDITQHVRLGIPCRDDPNRPELTPEQRTWIYSKIDPVFESFVNNLTYLCTNELAPTS